MTDIARTRAVVLGAAWAFALAAAAGPAAAQTTTVTCESTQGERAFCSADTSRGVTLKRELGDASCTGNWGFDESGIWVDKGCRAELLLGQASEPSAGTSLVDSLLDALSGGRGGGTSSGDSVVVCESRDNRRVTCKADTRGGVELRRQLSKASCSDAWGYTATGIWVDRGCRAEFLVKAVQEVAEATPAPTATPVPEVTLNCESKDDRRAFCSADTRGGVDLVLQLGGAPCIGRWGYDADGIWVVDGCRARFKLRPVEVAAEEEKGTVACSSKRNRRSFCSAVTLNGVQLVRQLSETSCAGNWGYDADGIWVDRGCSALFNTSRVRATPTPTPLPRSGSVVTCASATGERTSCPADTSTGVKLQRQLSTSSCVGHWGYDAGGIWVDGGCRAEFLIR